MESDDTPDLSSRARGQWGERRAAAEYRRLGYEILARNWRSPERELRGEIDVVARRSDEVVFCEVKARRSGRHGGAVAAVDERKQLQVRLLADCFLRLHDLDPATVRFDVIAIDGVRLAHFVGAF